MSLIKFGHPKCILLIIIIVITKIINQIIINHFLEYLKPFFNILLMFIGEFLSIFFYLYQRYNQNIDINHQFKIKNKKYTLFFIFVIFICSLSDFLSSTDYFSFFSFNFQKINSDSFNMILIFISCYINEKFFLNIKNYIHHYIGITLNIIPLIGFVFIIIYENSGSFLSLLLFLIVIIEQNFLYASFLTMIKRLNYEYLLNVNLILFIQGFFGILLV